MTGSSYPPTYGGVGVDAYMEWEIAIDAIFATRFMCPRRKVNNATSVLRDSALTWWESLSSLDKPQTWNDLKIVMRETFTNPPPTLNSYDEVHQLEDRSIIVSLVPPNLLQDYEQKQEIKDDKEENEGLTSSCENSEPPLHNAPDTPTENTCNDHGATLTKGENCHNMLNFSTHHAIKEQLLVEPSLDLSLSHDDFFDVPCDKDELFDNASVLHVLEPNTYAENKHVIPISSANDEQNCCLLYKLWVTLNLKICVI